MKGREICYAIVGRRSGQVFFARLTNLAIGTEVSVEFDWQWVLRREEKRGDVLGFYHTHKGAVEPSQLDIKTMSAWSRCLGKPLICIIESTSDQEIYKFLPEYPAAYAMAGSYLQISKFVIGIT